MTVQALADKHGVVRSAVTKWFQKAGLEKLPVGRKPKEKLSKPAHSLTKVSSEAQS